MFQYGLTRSLVRLALAAEKVYAVVLILMLTDAFLPLYKEQGYGWVGRASFYGWKFLLLSALFFLFVRRERFFIVAKQGKFLLLFVGIALLSQYWSEDPSATRQSAIRLIETTLLGAYIATSYNYKEQTQLFGWAFGIAAVFSIFYVFGQPSLGIMNRPGSQVDGTWRGIYLHKNILGRIITIGGIFFLIKALTSPKNRWLWWVCFGITVQLILGTNSKTALVGFLFLLFISPIHRIFRWNPVISIPLYLMVLLLGGTGAQFLADNWNAALASIDKDPTLTGRVPLWTVLMGYIEKRPWLGYGMDGFWQGWEGSENASIWRTFRWEPSHAHNGFLDVVLEFGIVGATVYLLTFLHSLMQAVKWVRLLPTVESLWPIGYLTFLVLMNQTQSVLVVPYSIYWTLFVVISLTPVVPPEPTSQPNHPNTPPAPRQKLTRPKSLNPIPYRKKNL